MKALWGGRFEGEADGFFTEFNRSFPFDYRLFHADVACSKGYAGGLKRAGILSAEEYGEMIRGLDALLVKEKEDPGYLARGVAEGYEDIHAFVEGELGKLVGGLAKKLHTGRSRNDQVAADVRYYLKGEIGETLGIMRALKAALITKAEEHFEAYLPGYTHLQRAQPILWPHYCLSFVEMLERDEERLLDTRKRTDTMPLGSGALAGNNHAIDREALAQDLGFARVSRNSLDATSDRDFVLEFVQNAAISMVHLSRLAEDLILYSSHEFRFVKMSDKVATGSSLMPQKKNPDALELIRGKAGRVFGHAMGLCALMKGLPSCYNKDMQEDKEPLFDTVLQWQGCLRVMTTVIESMQLIPERMAQATKAGYLNATDLADYLVAKGVAFREAHHLVGTIVTYADSKDKALDELSLSELKFYCDLIDNDVYAAIDLKKTIAAKASFGGTAPERVRAALSAAKMSISQSLYS